MLQSSPWSGGFEKEASHTFSASSQRGLLSGPSQKLSLALGPWQGACQAHGWVVGMPVLLQLLAWSALSLGRVQTVTSQAAETLRNTSVGPHPSSHPSPSTTLGPLPSGTLCP